MGRWEVIPAARQGPGALIGGFFVVIQAWPIANLYTLALLGPEGMQITQGPGPQWEVTPRPRDLGITEWKGRTNYEASLDLLYDGWITHVLRPQLPAAFVGAPNLPAGVAWSGPGVPTPGGGVHIEGMCASLEALATVGRDMTVPPSLRCYGAVVHPEVRWVIQSIEWGDCIRDKVTGRRMRQQATVHLLEYNQPTDLAKLPRGKAAPAKKK